MKKAILCVLLTLSMSVSAFALEVPTDTVVQNLNGSQQVIKTFTIPADQDPQSLIEQPFELEGYLYTFTDIVKTENAVEESKPHTEVITVETDKNDLALILQQLKPTVEFDDGTFKGTLALDHTSLNTEASGYAAKSYTVSEVKTIGRLDRNDMSYVPSTTVKNGRTLSLCRCGVAGHGNGPRRRDLGAFILSGCCHLFRKSSLSSGYRIHHDRGIYRRDHARGRREHHLCTDLPGNKGRYRSCAIQCGRLLCGKLVCTCCRRRNGSCRDFRHRICIVCAPAESRSCRGG